MSQRFSFIIRSKLLSRCILVFCLTFGLLLNSTVNAGDSDCQGTMPFLFPQPLANTGSCPLDYLWCNQPVDYGSRAFRYCVPQGGIAHGYCRLHPQNYSTNPASGTWRINDLSNPSDPHWFINLSAAAGDGQCVAKLNATCDGTSPTAFCDLAGNPMANAFGTCYCKPCAAGQCWQTLVNPTSTPTPPPGCCNVNTSTASASFPITCTFNCGLQFSRQQPTQP